MGFAVGDRTRRDTDCSPRAPGHGRHLAWILGILLPVAAFSLYALLGDPGSIIKLAEAEEAAQHSAQDIESAIRTQKEKLAATPNDALGWFTLGVAYTGMDQWADAEQAFAKAYALKADDALIVSAYAEALAVNSGRDLAGKPIELVRKALELSPEDPKALELAGIHAFQTEEYAKAAYYWRQLVKQLPADSPYAQDIQGALHEAKRLAEEAAFGAPVDNRPAGGDQMAAASNPRTLTGTLTLDPKLADRVATGDTLYLFARAVTGGGAPLAGLKATIGQWPVPFVLDDSLAMLPDQVLSDQERVTLTARISKSGTPEPKPGDLEGQMISVTVGSQDIQLIIDHVRP